MSKLLFVFAILISAPAFSADQVPALLLQVHYGEKNSTFEIRNEKSPELVSNGKVSKFSESNLKEIIKMAKEASETKSNELRLCGRNYVQLSLQLKNKKPTQTVGCIGSKTPAADQLAKLANALLLL